VNSLGDERSLPRLDLREVRCTSLLQQHPPARVRELVEGLRVEGAGVVVTAGPRTFGRLTGFVISVTVYEAAPALVERAVVQRVLEPGGAQLVDQVRVVLTGSRVERVLRE